MSRWLAGLSVAWSAWVFGHAATPVTALSFSPDGQTLASAGRRFITLHPVEPTNQVTTLETDLPKITALAFHPAGEWLAVSGGTPGVKGAALLLRRSDGRELARVSNTTDVASALAFDAVGTRLAVAEDATVRIYEASSNRLILRQELIGHVGAVLGVAFSPDGSLLVTAGRDRSVKVWQADDGRLQRSFGHHTEAVHAVAFRPQPAGTTRVACATAGDDRTVRIWQPAIGRMVRIVRGHDGTILTLAYAADGRTLFTAGSEGIIRQVDADSDVIQRSWRASEDWIYALAVSPDGRFLAAGDWKGAVTLWTAEGVLHHRFSPVADIHSPP